MATSWLLEEEEIVFKRTAFQQWWSPTPHSKQQEIRLVDNYFEDSNGTSKVAHPLQHHHQHQETEQNSHPFSHICQLEKLVCSVAISTPLAFASQGDSRLFLNYGLCARCHTR